MSGIVPVGGAAGYNGFPLYFASADAKLCEAELPAIRRTTMFIDKTKIYVIYCDRGAMSMVICNKMSQLGFVTKTVVGGFVKYNGRYIV